MSHWAELDQDSKVLRVLVGDNNDPNGDEGYKWLIDNLGGRWVKTSYNAVVNGYRKNFAGTGYSYDEARDAFIAPQPFPSWVIDEDSCQWIAPIACPSDGKLYTWNEADQAWDEVIAQD